MRLQTDLEFKQKKIFALNKKYNVDIFSAAVRGGKAFAAEQKLKEITKHTDPKGCRKYELFTYS